MSVYDPSNKLEARLTFCGGTLAVDGRYEGDLPPLAMPARQAPEAPASLERR